MHRATAMADAGERVSFVNAYVSEGTDQEDPNRAGKLFQFDPSDAIYTEWVRHRAWRTSQKLRRFVADVQFADDRDALRDGLLDPIADAQIALDDLDDPAGAGRKAWHPPRLREQPKAPRLMADYVLRAVSYIEQGRPAALLNPTQPKWSPPGVLGAARHRRPIAGVEVHIG